MLMSVLRAAACLACASSCTRLTEISAPSITRSGTSVGADGCARWPRSGMSGNGQSPGVVQQPCHRVVSRRDARLIQPRQHLPGALRPEPRVAALVGIDAQGAVQPVSQPQLVKRAQERIPTRVAMLKCHYPRRGIPVFRTELNRDDGVAGLDDCAVDHIQAVNAVSGIIVERIGRGAGTQHRPHAGG